jgi:hypothetical protein
VVRESVFPGIARDSGPVLASLFQMPWMFLPFLIRT